MKRERKDLTIFFITISMIILARALFNIAFEVFLWKDDTISTISYGINTIGFYLTEISLVGLLIYSMRKYIKHNRRQNISEKQSRSTGVKTNANSKK